MRRPLLFLCLFFLAGSASAQIQVELKFKRLQYVAYEPILATLKITNLAGRAIELRNENSQHWFGFEVTAREGRVLPPLERDVESSLLMEAGQTVTRKINLTPLFPVNDLGTYHVRANVYFADLNKFFYSQPRVFQVGDARAIWERTVGVPEDMPDAGGVRTYSLLSNRFADHTSLYVRVADKSSGAVYSTFPLGRLLDYGEPQAELDGKNQLHVLHCAAPRTWAYSRIGLNGQLLAHATFLETQTRPRLQHAANGAIAVSGGLRDVPITSTGRKAGAKLSARPETPPSED